jgi:thioredoxin-related protein
MKPDINRLKKMSLTASLLASIACTHTPPADEKTSSATPDHKGAAMNEHHDLANDAVWFKGSVEEAFAKAKAEKKPLFLYWGAVWCPPCNELKAQVLSKPRFAELMAPFIAVYLDGDSERAQEWSDKLKVSGYPTLVLYNAEGKEAVRISEGVSIDEFEVAVASALHGQQSLEQTIQRCLAGKGAEHDWKLLAYVNWDGGTQGELEPAKTLTWRGQLIDKIPAKLTTEKALLMAQQLSEAHGNKESKELAATLADIQKKAPAYLDQIFATKETILAARNFIAYSPDLLGWIYPAKAGDYQKYRQKWLAAARTIENEPNQSIDVRLIAAGAEVQFYSLEHEKDKVPQELADQLREAVKTAMGRISNNYERHVVTTTAAGMLSLVGDDEAARKMLLDEAARSATPFYLYSALASMEKEKGNYGEALKYAQLARETAKGRATRLQWITSDLILSLEHGKNDTKRIETLVGEYYDLAVTLQDGFSGRNFARAKRIAKDLKPYMKITPIAEKVKLASTRCNKFEGPSKENCQKHFDTLL